MPLKLSKIKSNPNNPRFIRDEKFKQLVQSLKSFPKMMEIRPIVVDANFVTQGGNMRLKALKELGYKEVPDNWIKQYKDFSEAEWKEFVIKDNVGFGEWDWDMIANEWNAEDVTEWGLDIPDFTGNALEAIEDDYVIPDEIETDIVLGDVFEIGQHRLMCGDSTKEEDVKKLMQGQKADITIQSPPYNVGKTPNGNDQKYINDSDSKPRCEYLRLLELSTNNAISNSIFSFVNIQSVAGNKISVIDYLAILKNWFCDYIIWDKMQAEPAMGLNILNSRFEFVLVFAESAKRKIGVKKFRGNLENIIFIKSRQGNEFSKVHKAIYPVAFPAYFIENFSVQSCLDLFIGIGTTMVASEQLNRKCYAMDIEPKYCQVTIDRMQKLDPNIIIKRNGKPYKITVI